MGNTPNVFTRAILWVAHPQLLWHRAGGILVIERQLFTLARAGSMVLVKGSTVSIG